jgi:hypothetical protein
MIEYPYSYEAFGLHIKSQIELAELTPSNAGYADVTIRGTRLDKPLPAPNGNNFQFGSELQVLEWGRVGRFEIHGTSEIVFQLNADVPDEILRFPLLGSVMALLLQIRGNLALHASAVLVNGRGVAFMGDKGAGKSTTATALVSRGFKLIADDLLAFSSNAPYQMLPGFPQVKLTQASANVFEINDVTVLPMIDFPGLDKRQHNFKSHFSNQAAPLGKLFVLERGPAPAILPLSPTDAFHALVRFSHFRRFNSAAFATNATPMVMRTCARLAELDVVRRLVVPEPVERVFEIVNLISHEMS